MKKRLKAYLQYMESIDPQGLGEKERQKIKEDLLIQIGFFQHERLIHLLVTLAFALFTVGAVVCTLITVNIYALILMILFLSLTVPYVFHYYTLENGVQKLYQYYDIIR